MVVRKKNGMGKLSMTRSAYKANPHSHSFSSSERVFPNRREKGTASPPTANPKSIVLVENKKMT